MVEVALEQMDPIGHLLTFEGNCSVPGFGSSVVLPDCSCRMEVSHHLDAWHAVILSSFGCMSVADCCSETLLEDDLLEMLELQRD